MAPTGYDDTSGCRVHQRCIDRLVAGPNPGSTLFQSHVPEQPSCICLLSMITPARLARAACRRTRTSRLSSRSGICDLRFLGYPVLQSADISLRPGSCGGRGSGEPRGGDARDRAALQPPLRASRILKPSGARGEEFWADALHAYRQLRRKFQEGGDASALEAPRRSCRATTALRWRSERLLGYLKAPESHSADAGAAEAARACGLDGRKM